MMQSNKPQTTQDAPPALHFRLPAGFTIQRCAHCDARISYVKMTSGYTLALDIDQGSIIDNEMHADPHACRWVPEWAKTKTAKGVR